VVSQEVSHYLQMLSKAIPKEEMQMIQAKYHSLQISKMDDCEIIFNAAEVLRRIHVITGWSLPGDAAYMKTLTEEFVLFLKDRFWMLNFFEVAQAFRKNAIGIKDWGKNMNLELMAGVLGAYCHDREQLSYLEERAQLNNALALPEPKLTDEDVIEYNFETYRFLKDLRIIQRRCYGILQMSGKIKLNDTEKERIKCLAKTMALNEKTKDPSIDIEKFTNDHAKRIAVAEYFEKNISV
jgi:hypothetical protein